MQHHLHLISASNRQLCVCAAERCGGGCGGETHALKHKKSRKRTRCRHTTTWDLDKLHKWSADRLGWCAIAAYCCCLRSSGMLLHCSSLNMMFESLSCHTEEPVSLGLSGEKKAPARTKKTDNPCSRRRAQLRTALPPSSLKHGRLKRPDPEPTNTRVCTYTSGGFFVMSSRRLRLVRPHSPVSLSLSNQRSKAREPRQSPRGGPGILREGVVAPIVHSIHHAAHVRALSSTAVQVVEARGHCVAFEERGSQLEFLVADPPEVTSAPAR